MAWEGPGPSGTMGWWFLGGPSGAQVRFRYRFVKLSINDGDDYPR